MKEPFEVELDGVRDVIWGTAHYITRTFVDEKLNRQEGVLVDEQDWDDIRGLLIDYLHLLEGEEAA